MGKRKIGIEVQRLFRQKKHGMEVVALELIRELQKTDKYNEYTVFVKEDVDDQCIHATENFSICKLPSQPYPIWEQHTLPSAVRKQKLDFLHLTCNTGPHWLSIPHLLTLHDIIYLEKLNLKGTAYQNFGNMYRRLIVPRVAMSSKFVITVSEFEREIILKRLPLPENKVKVIYNAVGEQFHNRYDTNRLAAFKHKVALPNEFVLFLGNTAPKKNTNNVIRAYCKYLSTHPQPIPLVVLDYKKELVENQLKMLGQEQFIGKFVFPGYIPVSDMPLIYNLASFFLYPSLRESFGLPIVEAMACGTPVITSDTSCMPEIAAGAGLLTDPYNPDSIAEAIIRLGTDKSLHRHLTDKGLERSRFFTWRNTADQMLQIYSQM